MAILTRASYRSRNRYAVYFALLVMAVGWIGETSVSVAEEPQASEYQVKAAFLINFPKYANWPAEAFAETNSPIIIAVLGETPVAEEVQKAVTGRIINGRKIVLKRVVPGEEPGGCHILFISAAEQRRASEVLGKLRDASVLTVGENGDFLASGGIINLARHDQKIGLEVSLTAANRARIKISSKLLGVASVVETK